LTSQAVEVEDDEDDEGMGGSEGEEDEGHAVGLDSGFASGVFDGEVSVGEDGDESIRTILGSPGGLDSGVLEPPPFTIPQNVMKPDYKLLHKTRILLHKRVLSSSYRLTTLQTRSGPPDAHTSTIYCMQLYTHPATGIQTLFTGSRDQTIREWDLSTSKVTRVIGGVHDGSVLSICVHGGYVASAGSDRKVAVWDLEGDRLVRVIEDHLDSVLHVRFDDERLVSCSKG
jgi:WD40 repeat protein